MTSINGVFVHVHVLSSQLQYVYDLSKSLVFWGDSCNDLRDLRSRTKLPRPIKFGEIY